MRKDLFLIIVLAIIIAFLYWGINTKSLGFLVNIFSGRNQETQVTLNYWGLSYDENIIKPLIEEYEKNHPNVKIVYKKESIFNYRTRLQTQLRSGQGPDIFEIHSSWVPIFIPDLAAFPPSVVSISDFKGYYPIMTDTLVVGNSIYALPLEIDGLVLFYNEDLLNGANVGVPSTWQQFVQGAEKITVKNGQEKLIQTAGAAMGTPHNIEYWSDVVGLLFFQQPAGNPMQPSNKDGVEVIQFYTGFIRSNTNTWSETLPTALQMFTSGRLAFYIAPSRLASEIKQVNPNLRFKTAPVPQVPGRQVGWGRFWVNGVSRKSVNKEEAWEFVKFISSKESLRKINQQRLAVNQLPFAYPWTDMASEQENDPVLGAVVKQGYWYKNWFLNYNTGDAGVNDEIIKIYEDTFKNILTGRDSQQSLQETSVSINQVLAKYNLLQTQNR